MTKTRNDQALEAIAKSMKKNNISATRLGRMIGVSQPTMCRILDGRTRITLDHVEAIHDAGLIGFSMTVNIYELRPDGEV